MKPLCILKTYLILTLIVSACASLTWEIRKPFAFRKFSHKKPYAMEDRPKPQKFRSRNHVFQDMPTKSDLKSYVTAMEGIIKFTQGNKNDIDLNYAFGLFLMNVNLKVMLKHKHMELPLLVMQPIRDLVNKNNVLLKFFRSKVKKDKDPRNQQKKAIYDLFYDDTQWLDGLERYDAVFRTNDSKVTHEALEEKYSTWEEYYKHVFDWEKGATPSPKQSDICISALNHTFWDKNEHVMKCVLPSNCYDILESGSDIGYGLTHRLLLMMVARYGRGCAIFSPAKDLNMTNKFCTAAYAEAQYIALHHYEVIDLLLEQMLFCGIFGHTQLFRRSWIQQYLKYQTPMGCFSKLLRRRPKRRRRRPGKWLMVAPSTLVGHGICDRHTTSVAAGVLAIASKLVVQLFY